MRRSLSILILLALGVPSPGAAQEPIARIKSAPQDYRERIIRLEGEVVEVRGLTPVSALGIYRLVDPSDGTGVLVRTSRLPETTGPFRVSARLSPELLSGGSLLLDEVDRNEPLRTPPLLPILLAGAGLVAALVFAGLYWRVRRTERHHHLAPPIWLIPTHPSDPAAAEAVLPASPGGTAPDGDTTQFNFQLHYLEQEKASVFIRQKRRLVRGLVAGGAIFLTGAGWFAAVRADQASRPSFVLLGPDAAPIPASGDTAGEGPATPTDDTLVVALEPVPIPRSRVPESGAEAAPPPRTRAPSTGAPAEARPTPIRDLTQDPVPPDPGRQVAVAESVLTQPVTTAPPPPPPPPPPVVVEREPTPVAVPDPSADLRGATAAIQQGAQRFVSAISRQDLDAIARFYLPGGNAGWRGGLINHVRDYNPAASLGTVEPPVAGEAGVQAAFAVEFRWRGNFGVERRRAARFTALARRTSEGWSLAGVRLLEAFP